jgi:hypothetical protein
MGSFLKCTRQILFMAIEWDKLLMEIIALRKKVRPGP